MKFSTILTAAVVFAALAAAAVPASAAPTLSPDGTCPVVGAATQGCNAYIYVFDGSLQTAAGASATSYDGLGDTLVGIINNSSQTIASLSVSSYGDIFDFTTNGIDGFDSDGVAATGDNPDTTGYGGPDVYYTDISGSAGSETGTINFANGGLAPGGIDYFALVGSPDFSQSPTVNFAVPEPATLTILGFGMLAAGSARRFRRKG